MKRVIALLLVLATVFSFTACGGGGGGDDDGKKPVDDDGVYLDSCGEHNFNGEDFVISIMPSFQYEVYYEDDPDVDACDEATVKRNRRLEQRFNVNVVPLFDTSQNANTHQEFVKKSIQNSESTFDACMVQIWLAGALVVGGNFLDLRNDLPYVKDSIAVKDWWSADINNAYTVCGKQYVGVSDMNLSSLKVTWCILFNKGIEEDDHIASGASDGLYNNMYDLVNGGAWTLDCLRNIVKDRWEDDPTGTNPEVRDTGDKFGMISENTHLWDIFTTTCGLQYVVNDGESTPELAGMGLRFSTAVDRLVQLKESRGFMSDDTMDICQKFAEGQALFAATTLVQLESKVLHDAQIEFGVLPFPKLDDTQAKYHAGIQDAMSSIAVPTTVESDRYEKVGVMLEALSAESNHTVLPAYYDVILTHKNTRDEASIPMIDLIYHGRMYDFASLHSTQDELRYTYNGESGGLAYAMRTLVKNNTTDVGSFWAAINGNNAMSTRLDNIVDKYLNMWD